MAIDQISFSVFQNALVGVAEQMSAIIWRTSYSTVIREMLDYSTAVFDRNGRIVAQASRIPMHLNSMSRSLLTTMERAYPPETWEEGDIVLMNDPYWGGQHLPDIQTFMPVFAEGQMVAIVGTLGHHLDVGGMRPGSYAGDATEIFQEGLRIPPMKVARNYQLDPRFLDLFAANIRQPDKTLGDLRAQTAALEIGEKSVHEIVDHFGVEQFCELSDEAIDSSERRMRACLKEIPEGVYEAEYFVDDDGVIDERIRVAVKVTIGGGEIAIDFEGTDPQRKGPINATISSTESAIYYVIMSIADATIPPNYGCYKPIRISAPEGSVVNAQSPSPVVGRNAITHTIANVLYAAFSKAMPDKIPAAYYGMSNVHILSGDSEEEGGKGWIFFDIEVGGWGARPTKDGPDCYSQGIHNLANTPIEMVEATYPLRYTRYEFLADTGGAGQFRGGMGVARDIQFLDQSGMLNTQFDKFKVAPFGLFGGADGACGSLTLERQGEVVNLASKTVNQDLRKGDIISMQTQGGGGFGDPSKRDEQMVRRDLREGKVSPQCAQQNHGVGPKE
ncbi:MAG: hydantoinase B/oxoprolinase family protein [Rhodospirillaceae bacterium]|nr:hydantoinase B/oxoprolinase family protein [Rhodospirillaceae bacterium]MBT4933887.1 hydantoinase B/oxoprolinase family protein [Rhodospirillaceae bacterium]MBT5244454.1 hydantoinase B/oxoprolinase family protein [Rhodospirillaceae bacterium]MBT5561396.1 hydantoinase B/oxoprolinase family protein [Rhodospirillaceae bacterium]MBT6242036.1 hydantoinase B/oxoprolinase family protein [Rhodospirillaceae bacterium]